MTMGKQCDQCAHPDYKGLHTCGRDRYAPSRDLESEQTALARLVRKLYDGADTEEHRAQVARGRCLARMLDLVEGKVEPRCRECGRDGCLGQCSPDRKGGEE